MDWQIKNEYLTKEFVFPNFIQAVEFIDKITPLAEKLQHHPDILLHSYNKVEVRLYSHDQGKITDLDHTLAKKIDNLF